MSRCTQFSGLSRLARLGALSSLLITGSAVAREGCNERIVPILNKRSLFAKQLKIISEKDDQKITSNITFPQTGCRMIFSAEHASRRFDCPADSSGKIISGIWNTSNEDQSFAMASMPLKQRRSLPLHRKIRNNLLAPAFIEGYYINYPIDIGVVAALYPRNFTVIGKKTDIENPDARVKIQSLQYRTVDHRARAAVTGEAAIGCLKLNFVTWVSPDATEQTEQSMKRFLGDLRLEPASSP